MNRPVCLLLNGSPHRDGNSVRLAEAFVDALGGDCRRVDLYPLAVVPCTACGACSDGGDCPIPDGMAGVLTMLAEADMVVAASPLHFTSLSAPLVAFFSRLQPFWNGAKPPVRPRHGVLVATAGSKYPDMFLPARKVAAAAFKTLGIPFSGVLTANSTDLIPADRNPQALAEARSLADGLIPLLPA